MTSTKTQLRAWYPSPARGSKVEPTVPELLAMADQSRQDWRPEEPSSRDLAALDPEVPKLLAEFAGIQKQLLDTAERKLARTIRPSRRRALRDEIKGHWDAIGHLATGA
ncbi:hypothetical protein [Amycolatopsis sp. cg9]|uniref:hypothetical protein n=1 Tax=Amycolatopsis sp. cg9 TaxID=3238801 RepID=UPI0035251F3B